MHPPALRRRLGLATLLTTLALLPGCFAGPDAASTGSVGIVFTDNPEHDFSEILVSIREVTLIGEPGQVTIFRGHRVVDFRALEDSSTLFVLGRRVAPGWYWKIRLEIDDIELVRRAADGEVIERIHPKLPPKIDLNPQGGIHVHAGSLHYAQIDMDMEKSIHIVGTGNGGYRFRPVVFVELLKPHLPGRLVRLSGVVDDVDLEGGSFRLCRTHYVSRPGPFGDPMTLAPGDHADEEERVRDFCVEILVDDDTSIFDEAGDPVDLGALAIGDPASVLGRFARLDDDEDEGASEEPTLQTHGDGEDGLHDRKLLVLAKVVQLGPPGTTAHFRGVALGPVEEGGLELSLDPGQEGGGDTLLVLLSEGTKVVSRRGEMLSTDDIEEGVPLHAFGVVDEADGSLKATVLVLAPEAAGKGIVAGPIAASNGGGAELEVDTKNGPECVSVSDDTAVYRLTIEGALGSFEEIDAAVLQVGDPILAYGEAQDSCLAALKIVAFDVGADD